MTCKIRVDRRTLGARRDMGRLLKKRCDSLKNHDLDWRSFSQRSACSRSLLATFIASISSMRTNKAIIHHANQKPSHGRHDEMAKSVTSNRHPALDRLAPRSAGGCCESRRDRARKRTIPVPHRAPPSNWRHRLGSDPVQWMRRFSGR